MRRFSHVRNALVLLAVALTALSVTITTVQAADADKYSLVRVKLDTPGVEATLRANPDLDVIRYKSGSYAEIVVRDR